MISRHLPYSRRDLQGRLRTTLAAITAVCSLDAAAAPERTYIQDGRAVNVRTESGTWATAGSYLQAANNGATLSLGDVVTTGDFVLEVVMRGSSFSTNPGLVLINEIAEFGFVRSDSDSPMYVRGFFFGDITRNLVHRRGFFNDGEDFAFAITRTGDSAKITINGKTAWATTFESERAFGKISFRSQGGRLQLKSARLLSGNSAPLSQWVNVRTQEHKQPGEQVDVFSRGNGGYHTYRIPAVEMTRTGVLLAFCEGRRNSGSDHGDIDLLMKRSMDGGRTWEPQQVIHTEPGDVTIGNPVPVHDHRTNTTWLAFCRNNDKVFITKSHNDGVTWAVPREITADVKLPDWGWYATGPGHGLVTSSGRILIPANHGSKSHTFYSDDRGQTWQLGGIMPGYGNEVTVAETSDQRIYMNSRNRNTAYFRLGSYSSDGSETWGTPLQLHKLMEPTCQGSVRSVTTESGEHLMLFSNPASVRRERLTVRLSDNDGTTWSEGQKIYEGSAAYSDLVYLGDGWVGCLYERDWYDHLTFARFPLSWLRDSQVDHWMEEEVAVLGSE